MRTLADVGDLQGKRVLVRCDLNVPMNNGEISDDGRIRASVPTLKKLTDMGARVIVTAHLGRPKGEKKSELSLETAARRLDEVLDAPVSFCDELTGESATAAVNGLSDGQVLVLENVRFDPRETSKTDSEREELAKELSAFADAFVSDGFGVVHRKQASVYDIAKVLPAYAGELVEKEVDVLKRLTEDPARPYTVVLGGSKVSDKLGVIENLMGVANHVLVGGGMMFTFLKSQGHEVGTSLLEEDQLDTVREYVQQAVERGVDLLLPTDTVAATAFDADADHDVVAVSDIPSDRLGLDIGPDSAKAFADVIRNSGTIFWNGPMGVFEMEPFSSGTKTVAQALKDTDGFTVIGGGDSAAAVRQLGFDDSDFGHISTGGGASLEYLEGKQLPGLEVLS